VLIKKIYHQQQQGREASGGKHPASPLMGCQEGKAKNLPSRLLSLSAFGFLFVF
jgi:hypothetical protein